MQKVTISVPIEKKLKAQLQSIANEMDISLNTLCVEIIKGLVKKQQAY